MGSPRSNFYAYGAVFLGILASVALVLSCGGSSTTKTATTGTVNVSLTDPPSPKFSADFDHVYVTITKITANINSDAGPNDSGWQTLADFTSSPKQEDLPNLKADQTCLLSTLASKTLPAGKYQQIRLYLLANNASSGPANNACGSAGFNCVVQKDQQTGKDLPPQTLLLSSEAQTGIKIPSSQITSGGLTVEAGQAVDLVINFSAEQSLVHEGNGQWRLKPVLHAGEVQTTNNALSGTVVDSTSNNPIEGAVVWLERPDTSNPNMDIVVDSMETDASGNFSFCPLQAGATYDVVVTAMTGGTTPVTYNATVTLNVPVGTALGNIPMVAEPPEVGGTTTTSTPANIVGQVTTTAHSSTMGAAAGDATAATITLTALQDVGNGKMVTIPPFSNMPESLSFTTVATTPTVDNGTSATTCPTGTDCENYQLVLPASNPSVATFTSGQTTTWAAPAANPALYWVQAVSVMPSDSSTSDCTPSSIPTTFTAGAGDPLQGYQIGVDPAPLPDNTVTLDFGFVGCTAAP
jgi:hypothetical protein